MGRGASFGGIDCCRSWRRVRISELSPELGLRTDGEGSEDYKIT